MREDQHPLLRSSPPSSPSRLSVDSISIELPSRRRPRLFSRRRRLLAIFAAAAILFALAFAFRVVQVEPTAARVADSRWIATSNSAIDRLTCRWLGICGFINWWRYKEPSALGRPQDLKGIIPDFSTAWVDPMVGPDAEDSWSDEERRKREVPLYVMEYAPYVFLFDEERYWPSDPAEHLNHSAIRLGAEQKQMEWNLTLAELSDLNALNSTNSGYEAYLVSRDDPDQRPEWMLSRRNIPGTHQPTDRSRAPAVLICVSKPNNVLDAYWFFFYSYNEGNTVFGTRYGNHVGDWEHVMMRFEHREPRALYLSRHSWGSAYTYASMEKIGQRPVVFSANGSHAHYPTAGPQPYVLPFSILKDVTGRGPRWDPSLNFYGYTYELPNKPEVSRGDGVFRASTINPRAPTSWLSFKGHWGDLKYLLNDTRQYRFFGEKHFSSGPTGPRDKSLEREDVCDNAKCKFYNTIY